ncbi:regulator of G protein signaling domain-containing protein, partial [Hysterangium stoloniferum]
LETAADGRPFLKNTLDLFGTLFTSLELWPHSRVSKTFPYSFTTDEATAKLASLRFSQFSCSPGPNNHAHITCWGEVNTFCLVRQAAYETLQHFMDARLIENAVTPTLEKIEMPNGLYTVTPKGLHIIERFITNKCLSEHQLLAVFASNPVCTTLLHVKRDETDKLDMSLSMVIKIFRRFVGQHHVPAKTKEAPKSILQYIEYSEMCPLTSFQKRTHTGQQRLYQHCFSAVAAVKWLCDFVSFVGYNEAAEIAAHFERYGLIKLVSDMNVDQSSAIMYSVGSLEDDSSMMVEVCEFKLANEAIYCITLRGRKNSDWNRLAPPRVGSVTSTSSSITHEKPNVDSNDKFDHLQYILAHTARHPHFIEYLKLSFCDEYYLFWAEVNDLKTKFTQSSHVTVPHNSDITDVMESELKKRHRYLTQIVSRIYSTYLAPSSQSELIIDHTLRNKVIQFVSAAKQGYTHMLFLSSRKISISKLRTIMELYEEIQANIFQLLATDIVPEFIKTSHFLALKQCVED